jgi:hypothetical protein
MFHLGRIFPYSQIFPGEKRSSLFCLNVKPNEEKFNIIDTRMMIKMTTTMMDKQMIFFRRADLKFKQVNIFPVKTLS